MIASLYTTIGPASWLILGVCLIAVEVLIPGLYFLWFGLAALAVGIAALLVAIGWPLQIVAFLAVSCVSVLIGRLAARRGANRAGKGA
ncbi:NfeD family protein [Amorphus coralli]|uniref:NfeD family protein n=1 Tax=Amorphus coralli TaxID=340680 RepID=UPI0003740848|nr:NfeD family protein [Amorphus coralli]